MYESPIQLAIGEMQMKYEDEVYKCIQQYGINVDKEELIRALQYDRDQYNMGFKDGVIEFAERIKKKSKKRVSDIYGARVYIQDIDDTKKEMVGDV